jgi:hypothetical protein
MEVKEDYPDTRAVYHYRRELSAAEFLPAVGAAVGVGVIVFYLTSILIQRTPLVVERSVPTVGPRPARTRRPAGLAGEG